MEETATATATAKEPEAETEVVSHVDNGGIESEINPSAAESKQSEIIESAIDLRESEIEAAVEARDDAAVEVKDGKIEIAVEVRDREIEAAAPSDKTEVAPAFGENDASNEEGGRVITMRELLNELKQEEKGSAGGQGERSQMADSIEAYDVDGQRDSSSRSSSYSQHEVSMELINSVTGVDEEGRSRQRILLFAAKKHASALERNPKDHDAYYNFALVLQESAESVSQDSASSKDALLELACKKYEAATRFNPTLYDAYYNWAIAISDRAKIRGRTKEAEELWKQAAKNYEKAVQLNWNSPQALNNWGLALQELSAIVPVREKKTIIRTAISKFRAAIQLQFDFHRAIYNLGTVLYGLAEDTFRSGKPVSAKEVSPDELYCQSAIYIAAAHALKPSYSVYHSALRLVRSMLPLPYLKVGYLTAPPVNSPIAPHKDWERSPFVLNHDGLQQLSKPEKHLSQSPSGKIQGSVQVNKSLVRVDVSDIVSVTPCADLTLPPGAGLCIDTVHGPVFLVADTWDSLDGWLDAIRLVYTIYARGKTDTLASIITG